MVRNRRHRAVCIGSRQRHNVRRRKRAHQCVPCGVDVCCHIQRTIKVLDHSATNESLRLLRRSDPVERNRMMNKRGFPDRADDAHRVVRNLTERSVVHVDPPPFQGDGVRSFIQVTGGELWRRPKRVCWYATGLCRCLTESQSALVPVTAPTGVGCSQTVPFFGVSHAQLGDDSDRRHQSDDVVAILSMYRSR